MDYETSAGAQFSLREIWTERDGKPIFAYTIVSAYVDGTAYVGKLPSPPDEVDDVDALDSLEPVPPDCIHPKCPEGLTIAPNFDPANHYLKAPSFTYDDCRPGKTFVADCVLNEVSVFERLKTCPHRNLVKYLGCVVRDGRITHICLEKNSPSLAEEVERGRVFDIHEVSQITGGIREAISHLHWLGVAHNDINPENICLDHEGEAIIIDFDCCLPFGEKLMKGTSSAVGSRNEAPVSDKRNDLNGLEMIQDFLLDHAESLELDEDEESDQR